MKSTVISRSFLVFLLSLFTLIMSTRPAGAQAAAAANNYTFVVNTTADTHDINPGDGVCADQNGQCSVRAAIEESDALPAGSSITITVPAGTYGLTLGTLQFTANAITINGASNPATSIVGNHKFTIMQIFPVVSVFLNQLSISAGKGKHGGGINNEGQLSVSNSTISGNKAGKPGWGKGAGIYNVGMLTVNNSTISGNSHVYLGAGIYNASPGTVNISNSTISGNTAGDGGGLLNYYGNVTIANSTISGNSASDGGGIYNYYGTMSITNSTISSNSYNQGAGISSYNAGGGSVTLTATIVAHNSCYGPIAEGVGYNLEDGTSCGFHLNTDLNNTDPMLGPLSNNGGPTSTMALLQGSPAIDRVALNSCPSTDQRGYVRPDNGESACDIGAYESAY